MFTKPVGLLQPETEELDRCLLCNKTIHKHELQQSVGASGLKNIEEKAKVWEKINVLEDDDKYREFTKVVERLTRLQGEYCNFNVHGSCCVSFRTQCDKKLEQHGMVIESPTDEQSSTDSQILTTEMSTEKKRHSERVVGKPKLLCFVCNTKKRLIQNHIMKLD